MPRNSCHLLESLWTAWKLFYSVTLSLESIENTSTSAANWVLAIRHDILSLSNEEQSSMRCPRVNNRAIFPVLSLSFSLVTVCFFFLTLSLIPLCLQLALVHSVSQVYWLPYTLCHLNCVCLNLQAKKLYCVLLKKKKKSAEVFCWDFSEGMWVYSVPL